MIEKLCDKCRQILREQRAKDMRAHRAKVKPQVQTVVVEEFPGYRPKPGPRLAIPERLQKKPR